MICSASLFSTRAPPITEVLTLYRLSGPNWIHASDTGGHPNPILQAANETNTPLHHWNDKQLIFDTLGNTLDSDKADRLSTLLWEIIEEAFSFSEEARQSDAPGNVIPEHDSLYDFISRRALERLPDDGERDLLLRMSEMFGAYVGEPVWRQSLRFAWLEECCGGGESRQHRTRALARAELDGQTRSLSNPTTLPSWRKSQDRLA